MGPKKQHNEGVSMRDYTYVEGYRFNIWNIYRSKRFDVDRLDINFADKDLSLIHISEPTRPY